jgi:hypothetical protein
MAGPWEKFKDVNLQPGPWSKFSAQPVEDQGEIPVGRGGYLDTLIPRDQPLPAAQHNPQPTATQALLGNDNPLSRAYDFAVDAADLSSDRPAIDRAMDTANFVAAAPFRALRAPTPGDVAAYFGYPGAVESEQRFIENNPGIINAVGAVGEVSAGLTGGLGQGVKTIPVRRPSVPGANAIGRARANMGESGAYGSIVDDLPGTLDEFSNQVATGGARFDVATNRRTLDILGEEMQRHGGNVPAAQSATISRIVDETGVTPQTAAAQIRRLSSVHEDSPLMLGEYPGVAVSDTAQRLRRPESVNLDELGRTQHSTTQATMDYLANNGNAQSAQNVRNAVANRQETLAPSLRETLEDIGPRVETGPRSSRPATIQDTADLVETATRIGQQEYRAAHNGPINNRVSLHWLPRILDANLNRAAGRAGEAKAAIERAVKQFFIDLPSGQRLAMNTLRQMQDARTTLRGQISEYHRSGRADLANAVQPLYDQITRVMSRMSPQWSQANRRWADMNFAQRAQELGDALSAKAGPRFRQQMQDFADLAPEAQQIVRVHFLQQLYDKLDNLGDTHSVSKTFSNDHARNMIRQMFGDEAAVSFTRSIRDQKVAESSQRMMGNSATHRRGVAQKQKDAETGLVAAAEMASARGVRNWLLERMTQILTERRNRPMADVLTTPLSDTAKVAQHLNRMRVQQERLNRYRPRATDVPNTVIPVPPPISEDGER